MTNFGPLIDENRGAYFQYTVNKTGRKTDAKYTLYDANGVESTARARLAKQLNETETIVKVRVI